MEDDDELGMVNGSEESEESEEFEEMGLSRVLEMGLSRVLEKEFEMLEVSEEEFEVGMVRLPSPKILAAGLKSSSPAPPLEQRRKKKKRRLGKTQPFQPKKESLDISPCEEEVDKLQLFNFPLCPFILFLMLCPVRTQDTTD